MIREEVVIGGPVGLHARPAAEFVKLAERFKSRVRLAKDGIWVNGKSILAILTLAAEKGSTVILEVSGEDEAEAFAVLKEKLTGDEH
ncbi:MAG: HPr family phosphocarrier protein [candidate division WOR-3 bacterium]